VTQPPVRYENYPPDDSASPAGSPDEHTPVIRPYVPATIPPPPTSDGTSRRTVIGLVIGIPIVGIALSAMAMNRNPSDGSGDGSPDNSDNTADSGSTDEEFSVGDHSATAPSGWTVHDDGSGTVEMTNGANRLTAASIDTATSTLAVEEIAHLAKRHYAGFTGKIGDPVDRSSAELQHATMDGTGRFQGKAARLMVELWIDEEGSGLLVARVLTAKVTSVISAEAQEMLDDLSGDF
jgi:hypothetical protein